jgi:IMP dehydrogenase/GMP reductase
VKRRLYFIIKYILFIKVNNKTITQLLIANDCIVHNSVCTTRIKTGVGRPQLSTIIDCADAAHGLKGCVVSDGGCKNSGDIAKAFGAGADFVMLGGMMAGHDESAGEIVEENGERFKEFYGMSSNRAMVKHRGEVAKYRASEGKRVLIKYRGPIENTINDILGGVRSTCTYVGASKLKELSKRMSHRGPDESDLHVTEKGHILSHERLSIIDLHSGRQPIQGSNTAWMVHNGEVYNHQELRDGILKHHTFRTKSDSEVIVHLYEEFGYDF